MQVLTSGFTSSPILHHIYLHSCFCPGRRQRVIPPCFLDYGLGADRKVQHLDFKCTCVRTYVCVCYMHVWGMLVLKGFCPRTTIMDGERDFPDGRGGDDLHHDQQQEKNKIDTHRGAVCMYMCVWRGLPA